MTRNALIIIALIVAFTSGVVGYNKYTTAQWEAKREQAMIEIEEQRAKEAEAEAEKNDLPEVDESHPARYLVPEEQVKAEEEAKAKAEAEAKAKHEEEQANMTYGSSKTTNTTSPTKTETKEEPKVIPTQTAKTTTKPPVKTQPEVKQATTPAITSLSSADITRLQGYPTYGSAGEGFFESFSQVYSNPKHQADLLIKDFHPATLNAYKGARVEWLTSPHLIYSTVIGQYAFRGVITVTFYGQNSLGLKPDQPYQCDAEYRFEMSTDTNGLSWMSTNYLSGFKAVSL